MPVPAGRPGRHSRHEKTQHGGQVFRPPVLGSVSRCDLILVIQDLGVGPVLQQQGDKRVVPSIRGGHSGGCRSSLGRMCGKDGSQCAERMR
jgi:hypothetical protein